MYIPQQQYGPDYFYRDQTDNRYFTKQNLQYYFFNYRGRISRSEYWFAVIILWFATLLVSFLTVLLALVIIGSFNNTHTESDMLSLFGQLGAGLVFLFAYCLVSTIASYMLAIKRAHDRNRPGWFILLSFVPIANIWVCIEVAFLRGTDGDNPYGNDPRLRFGVQPPRGYQAHFAPPFQDGANPGSPSGRGFAQSPPTTAITSQRTTPLRATPQPEAASPIIVAMSGEYAGSKIPIDSQGIVIGRDPERCNLVMASKDISRVHAKITCRASEKQFLVEDLQSKNGIYIGRERINGRAVLSCGESFTLSEDAATFMVNFE